MADIRATFLVSATLTLAAAGAAVANARPLSLRGPETAVDAGTTTHGVAPQRKAFPVVTISPQGVITATGHPGSLTLGRSTIAAVEHVWGHPSETESGGFEVAYCSSQHTCELRFSFTGRQLSDVYDNQTAAVRAFATTITTGTTAAAAERRLGAPAYSRCENGNIFGGGSRYTTWLEKDSPLLALSLYTASIQADPVEPAPSNPQRATGGVISGGFDLTDRHLEPGNGIGCSIA